MKALEIETVKIEHQRNFQALSDKLNLEREEDRKKLEFEKAEM